MPVTQRSVLSGRSEAAKTCISFHFQAGGGGGGIRVLYGGGGDIRVPCGGGGGIRVPRETECVKPVRAQDVFCQS